MELREVPIADIYPDEKNPRKDFGDIGALADSFRLNALYPGQPVNPIVVVADGGIYRIVDGERRYKAMKKNKVIRCQAVVCEEMDEANAMVAMVATDDKLRMSDIEVSRGVQQMMLLGVDPERIEAVGRMKKGSTQALRRARKVVDDAGDDMSLERMLAIAEFETLNDTDTVEELTNCKEEDWYGIAKRVRRNREYDIKSARLKEAAQAAGIKLVSEQPSYNEAMRKKESSDPAEIEDILSKLPGSTFAWIDNDHYAPPEICFYVSRDASKTEAELQRDKRYEELTELLERGKARRARWYVDRLAPGAYNPLNRIKDTPNVDEFLMRAYYDKGNYVTNMINNLTKLAGGDVKLSTRNSLEGRHALLLYADASNDANISHVYIAELIGEDNCSDYCRGHFNAHIDWLTVLESDGYVLDDGEIEIRDLAVAAIEKGE